jgi:hypothetical protein
MDFLGQTDEEALNKSVLINIEFKKQNKMESKIGDCSNKDIYQLWTKRISQ